MTDATDTAGVIAPPPLLAAVVVALGLLLDWLFPAYVLAVLLGRPERFVIGGILIGGGAALSVVAVRAFRSAKTNPEPWKPSTALVADGIFGWLRNPMYVGSTLILVGLAILLASDWMLVMTIVFAIVLHFGVVKREERYLEAKFGNAYRSYKAKVTRYGWPSI